MTDKRNLEASNELLKTLVKEAHQRASVSSWMEYLIIAVPLINGWIVKKSTVVKQAMNREPISARTVRIMTFPVP